MVSAYGRSYGRLLRVRGSRTLLAAGVVARIGGAMWGVAVTVMVSARQGSFALAGAMLATGIAVLAIAGPVTGRLIDRFGQRRVVLPFLAVGGIAGLATVALSLLHAPNWTMFVTFAVASFLPEAGPLTRARWAHLFEAEPTVLHTAMSLQQVSDEVAFAGGPVIAAVASTALFPEGGLLVAEILFVGGMVTCVLSRSTEPPIVPREHRPAGLAIRQPGLLLIAGVLSATGVIFGANTVVTVAVAEQAGRGGFSGVILAAFSLGSMVSGLTFGTRVFRMTFTRRLVLAALAMFVLQAPVLIVTQLWALALVMVIAGLATAPMLITALSLAERLIPRAFVTEGIAVAITGIYIGTSLGFLLGGWAIEALGPHNAYSVQVSAGLIAFLILLSRYQYLEHAEIDARDLHSNTPNGVILD